MFTKLKLDRMSFVKRTIFRGAALAGMGLWVGACGGSSSQVPVKTAAPAQESTAAPKKTTESHVAKTEAPAVPANSQHNYFVMLGNEKKGPFTFEAVTGSIQTGGIQRDTLVWREGMTAWTPAGQISELIVLFTPNVTAANSPATPPAAPGAPSPAPSAPATVPPADTRSTPTAPTVP
jgi:hypothetical protein